MVDTRPTSRTGTGSIRPDTLRDHTLPGLPPAHTDPDSRRVRQRIPTMRQLAALVVNGMLMLPRNYRRGMFLDILV